LRPEKQLFRPDFFIIFVLGYLYGIIKKVVCALLCAMMKQERNPAFLKAVGRRLRQLREQHGLSQEKVQFKTGIYLAYVENGLRNPTITTLIDICRYYGTTLEEFFAGLEPYDEAPRVADESESENDATL
jgi:DNA-binding XRE family transcriptional regulator